MSHARTAVGPVSRLAIACRPPPAICGPAGCPLSAKRMERAPQSSLRSPTECAGVVAEAAGSKSARWVERIV
jgi:hypothetical protein